MRIISDFHDYYDVGMKNGVDPQLPYRRFRREEAISFPTDDWRSFGRRVLRLSKLYRFFYVGFAGKTWSGIDVTFGKANELSLCFEQNLLEDSFFIDIAKNRSHWKCFGRKPKREKDIQFIANEVKEEISECFEFKNSFEFLNLFEKFKTAIFVYQMGSDSIVINERLNQYSFQRILPPTQAFQELAMYVGAYLTKPVIEEPPISDKIKAEIHGFDKFSFRKEKQKK